MINQELNSIMNQGYELIKTDFIWIISEYSGGFQGLHDGGVKILEQPFI